MSNAASQPSVNSTQDAEDTNRDALTSSPNLNLSESRSSKDARQDNQESYSDLEPSDNPAQKSTIGKVRL